MLKKQPVLAGAFLFLQLIFGRGQNSPSNLEKLIKTQEQLVRSLAEHATEQYARRINRVRTCTPSEHWCSDSLAEGICSESLGTPPYCTGPPGLRLNATTSVSMTPPNVNLQQLPDSIKESICVHRNIEDFIASAPVDVENDAWIYVGTRNGHFRIWPGSPRTRSENGNPDLGGCHFYDPRKRPWFIGASTGPKDIVLIVDKSGSMNDRADLRGQSKWDVITAAVNEILDTFTFADFVNIVTFSDGARPLWTESGLARGRVENLEALKRALSEEIPEGHTHFAAAFREAFELLGRSCREEPNKSCSGCHKIILFLTDGKDTSVAEQQSIRPSDMATLIEEFQEDLSRETEQRAVIFTYSITRQSDDDILRQLACSNDGAWSLIDLRTDPLDALNSYFSYIAAGRSPGSPIWIEPYEDANGLGTVTTVAMPFYAGQTSRKHRVFLGVVGVDVRLKTLEERGAVPEEVVDALIDRSESCTFPGTSDCEMQLFRNALQDRRSICPDLYRTHDSAPGAPLNETEGGLCYAFNGFDYRPVSNELPWHMAESWCEDDGGRLASVGDEDELAFLASLASRDGSWIGARPSRSRDLFKWLDRSVPNLLIDSDYWAVGEPYIKGSKEHAVVLDSRGVIGNLWASSVIESYSFICEYPAEGSCGENRGSVPQRGFFKVPPISSCEPSEYQNVSQPVKDVEDLDSRGVMQDVGTPRLSNTAAICCSRASYKAPSCNIPLVSFMVMFFTAL